jgi:hypothetical protein
VSRRRQLHDSSLSEVIDDTCKEQYLDDFTPHKELVDVADVLCLRWACRDLSDFAPSN